MAKTPMLQESLTVALEMLSGAGYGTMIVPTRVGDDTGYREFTDEEFELLEKVFSGDYTFKRYDSTNKAVIGYR